METGLDCFKKALRLGPADAGQYSPLALAYIGDSIYDLLVRTMIMSEGNMPVQQLHRKASGLVKAARQSQMMEKILLHLTEEEERIYKRGKNAKPHTIARNASLSDYHRATGFVAVMGYLYLSGDMKRIVDLVKIGLE